MHNVFMLATKNYLLSAHRNGALSKAFRMRVINFLFCFALIVSFYGCGGNETLFREVSSGKSGIEFSNNIVENDSINPLDITNIYNGGGVGVGDFNNDGFQDLYFTGNTVSSRLYLNKGKFEFEDITDAANVAGNGEWCRG